MLRTITRLTLPVAILLSGSGLLLAAPPEQLINARVETRAATQPLGREVASLLSRTTPFWIGYRTATVGGPRRMCANGYSAVSRILLEPPAAFTVLTRIDRGQLVRLQTATDDCQVDAGGLDVVWLEGVAPGDSVAWLASLITSASLPRREREIVQPALAALVWHPGQAALDAVVNAARRDTSPRVRSQALFWLSQRAGQQAVAAINTAVDSDPETEVKKKAVFALSQLPDGEGVPRLIDLARTHANREVRKQAMFWLGQSKDPRALGFFEEVLRR